MLTTACSLHFGLLLSLGWDQKASLKVICLLKNYLWIGSILNCCCQVVWVNISERKTHGELDLVDPIEVVDDALLSKWIMHTLEPNNYNIQKFLRL